MPRIDKILQIVRSAEASDLHLIGGSAPLVRMHGQLERTRHRTLPNEEVKHLIYEILSDDQIHRFEKTGDLDMAYGVEGLGRFRVNVYKTHAGIGVAIRIIPDHPPGLAALGFSQTVAGLAESKCGLVLVTGPTNSGKTTTLASMVDHINVTSSRHIVTLEDPIEYIHTNKNSLVSQRQIGLHSESFTTGLRAALREDPDVVLVGEMRDLETIALAITAAEVGLLVMGTLHTRAAAATVDRIIEVFPVEQQQQIRVMLADSLKGVISQQLPKRADGRGRVAAYEMMVQTNSIASLIREQKTFQIPTAIQTGRKQGMQLLDNHLMELVEAGTIAPGDAMKCANDPARFTEAASRFEHQKVRV
ncbi:MAG: type IV pilus twitching motility protein PilT [bacterium]